MDYDFQLLQKNGHQLFQGTFISDRIILPMELYPDGMYYVRITKGNKSVVKRIYIKN
ncbi:MAG: T9SS type A sorting domain-containing protein [Cyclobacteriaceae bacterium]